MSAQRVRYDPEAWVPGDPLYVRPTSPAGGNHVRRMVDLIPDTADERCGCHDKASWPEPLQHHQLDRRPA